MRTSANMITVIVKMRSREESPIRIFGGAFFGSARASVLCCVVLCCVVLGHIIHTGTVSHPQVE
jgi:hypothetical protein